MAGGETVNPPSQWPPTVVEEYDAVRELGKGGFASVMLARQKSTRELVAIKVVGGGSDAHARQERGYAFREIDILREIQHPCVMKLVQFWEPDVWTHKCAAILALSYAKGPTAESLLQIGGAFSRVFARVVGAQIIDAVAFLHSRAVIHRDIKPDNLIISNANKNQAEIWDEVIDFDDRELDWKALIAKWHVTLVDFGFARALTPADLAKKVPKSAIPDLDSSRTPAFSSSVHSNLNPSEHSNNSSRSSLNGSRHLRRSVSYQLTRRMSALGNRSYAAPEVQKNVQTEKIHSQHGPHIDVTKTLSDHVSVYGLMADAFSVGSSLKYFLTGCIPTQNVDELIALENSPVSMLCNMLCYKSTAATERTVKYRSMTKVAGDVKRLVQGLMVYDPKNRTSLKSARFYPWVDEIIPSDHPPVSKEISYLSFTKEHTDEETTVPESSSQSGYGVTETVES